MKILAAVCLHYGKEYLRYAVESVINSVDEVLIVYSHQPSHGHGTQMVCPDSREDLAECLRGLKKVKWIEIHMTHQENQHRQYYIDYARRNHFDQVLVVDSDEVHDPEQVDSLLIAAAACKVQQIGVRGERWITPWKSFNEYVQDGFAPIRVHNLDKPMGTEYVTTGMIYHMGYCISDDLMRYKISCHGHKDDFARNRGWFEKKWLGYQKGITRNLHPATDAYWHEAKPFDKTTLPDILKKHPRYAS